MDLNAAETFVRQEVDSNVIPSLTEFVRIPNSSRAFDTEWATNGLLDRAADHVKSWVEAQGIEGLTIERIQDTDAGPLLYIEIEPKNPDAGTILMYGHMDKQPPMEGWSEGYGAYEPVLKDGSLYGRGGVDDGYSIYAGMTIIKTLQKFGLPHGRIVFIMESEEESSSLHLMTYINNLRSRIGEPNLILCIDSGGGNYEQLWTDASLRGNVKVRLSVSTLKSSMHSGEGSGVVASSFRVIRQLLDRIEDSHTGRILLPELYIPLTPKIYSDVARTVQTLGEAQFLSGFTKHDEVEFTHKDVMELYLNGTYRPTLSVLGSGGMPDMAIAGNVLRAHTDLKLSIRIPPGLDPQVCYNAIERELIRDPPYNARVTVKDDHSGPGFLAPEFEPWLDAAMNDSSNAVFGKEFVFSNAGGTIPLMAELLKLFPKAQYLVTGALGPNSNAHCPNESLNIEFLKKFITCMVYVVHKHATH